MESTGMFCTSWRIHLYSGLEVWGDLSDVRKSRAFGIKMNSDLKQILFRLLVCQGGLLDPLGPCLIRARVTIFALGLSLPKNDVQILANFWEHVPLENKACRLSGDQKIPFLPIQDWVSKKRLCKRRAVYIIWSTNIKWNFSQFLVRDIWLIWQRIIGGFVASKPPPDSEGHMFPIQRKDVWKRETSSKTFNI